MRARLALGVFGVLLYGWAAGQPRLPAQRAAGDAFFAEAIAVPGPDSATVRIDLHLRIDYGFFVPVRDDTPADRAPFVRRGEILVELQDSLGHPLDRTIKSLEMADEVSERELPERSWYQTTVSLHAPLGRYQFLIEIDDRESDRKLVDQARSIDATRPSLHSSGSSVILEDAGASAQDSQIWVQNFGGDVLFGRSAALLVSLPPGDAQAVDANVVIRTDAETEKEPPASASDTIKTVPVMASVVLEPVGEEGRVGYEIRAAGGPSGRFVIIPLPTETLLLRRYVLSLTIRDGPTTISLERKFRALWPEMPFSLRDVDVALASLRYIVTEETLDSLMDGDFRTRRRNLEQFWQARDRTPGTIENEVMTQYYRRVDYARRHFGTIRQPDGFRSDRGRIFILNGKPTSTERELDPQAGFREVWTYRHLGKRFVFVDPGKTGNYVLTATDGL